MKHLKTYEKHYDTNILIVLSNHIKNFLNNFLEYPSDVDFRIKSSISLSFKYFVDYNNMKHLFRIHYIDYHSGDLDRYFEPQYPNHLFQHKSYLGELYNPVLFVKKVLDEHISYSGMIKYSDIDKIINEISMENYNIFVDSLKYNL